MLVSLRPMSSMEACSPSRGVVFLYTRVNWIVALFFSFLNENVPSEKRNSTSEVMR